MFPSLKGFREETERLVKDIQICTTTYEGTLTPDDIKIGIGSGGCGYGDPIDRALEAGPRDVSDGLVSFECVRDNYG